LQKQRALNVEIGSIIIDCNKFDKMLAFWQDTLTMSQVSTEGRMGDSSGSSGKEPERFFEQDPEKCQGQD